jgi:SAM-dependent methyltransferase
VYAAYYPETSPGADEVERQLANPTFAARRRRLEEALDGRSKRIFEIGCGDGNFLAFLRRAGWEVHGSEFDAGTVALVEQRHGIRVTADDVRTTGAPDAPYQVVGAYHVLEHIYDPAGWLAAVRSMLMPGGLLHLQVPNYDSLTRLATGSAWASWVFPQHVYFYTPRTLSDLIERAGFEVLSITTWDPWHGPGTAATSLAGVARRIAGARRPGERPACPPTAGGHAPGGGETRFDGLLLRVLRRIGSAAARMEAWAGRGAVVDLIAARPAAN